MVVQAGTTHEVFKFGIELCSPTLQWRFLVVPIGCTLIGLLVKLGCLVLARKVIKRVLERNMVI